MDRNNIEQQINQLQEEFERQVRIMEAQISNPAERERARRLIKEEMERRRMAMEEMMRRREFEERRRQEELEERRREEEEYRRREEEYEAKIEQMRRWKS